MHLSLTIYNIYIIKRKWAEAQITTGYEDQMEAYWVYFVKTWIVTYKPATWNVHHLITDENGNRRASFEGASKEEIMFFQRTNNCLERFNRDMNAAFPCPHPSMGQFVQVIKETSGRYLERIRRMEKGHEKPPDHNISLEFAFPPTDYN